jgi:hypothetical protein
MKRSSIVVLVLCACFISVGWGQQPAGTVHTNWSEFHRPNMRRWNPYENVLSVNNVGVSTGSGATSRATTCPPRQQL